LKWGETDTHTQTERERGSEGRRETGRGTVRDTTCIVHECTENTHELEQTGAQLRDEQQRRKQLHTQLSELREANTELTATKDTAELVCIVSCAPNVTVSGSVDLYRASSLELALPQTLTHSFVSVKMERDVISCVRSA